MQQFKAPNIQLHQLQKSAFFALLRAISNARFTRASIELMRHHTYPVLAAHNRATNPHILLYPSHSTGKHDLIIIPRAFLLCIKDNMFIQIDFKEILPTHYMATKIIIHKYFQDLFKSHTTCLNQSMSHVITIHVESPYKGLEEILNIYRFKVIIQYLDLTCQWVPLITYSLQDPLPPRAVKIIILQILYMKSHQLPYQKLNL